MKLGCVKYIITDVARDFTTASGVANVDLRLSSRAPPPTSPDRRHTYPCHCHSKAGSSGHDRGDRVRCSDIRVGPERTSGLQKRPR